MSLAEYENKVKRLISQDKKEEAVKLLFEMIVSCARTKQFQKAETLRQQIMQINSMALKEIIESAEIIETEKAKSIDQDHKNLWATLYNKMSTEEANDFYFSLKKIKIMPGKTIIKQGRINNRLFLIDSGTVQVILEQDNKLLSLKIINYGEIIGSRTFFSISLSTVTMITNEATTFHYLERESLKKLLSKHPGFDRNLESWCKEYIKTKIANILKEKTLERRRHKRYRAAGRVSAYLLNAKGELTQKRFVGELEDISKGGISFSIQQSRKEIARLLLGRPVQLKITSEKNSHELTQNGLVTGVFNQLFHRYLINFKFNKLISSEQVKKFEVSD